MANDEDALYVARAMIRFGGSFVSKLGEALLRADGENCRKIKETFPEYWENYQRMVKHIKVNE